MTATAPVAEAGDVQINFGAGNRNVRGGGSDAMAREMARKASSAAEKAQSDLKDIQAKLNDAVVKAQAAADASRDISAKLAIIDQKLAALEMAKTVTATAADDKSGNRKDDTRRAPTPEECLAARDQAILMAERTAIAEQAAKLDVQRREADLAVLRLQAQEKRAIADLATARAQEAAAKLALAQAEADREKNRATGLSGDASRAETAVADSQRELDEARSRASDAQRRAADADQLAKRFGATPAYRAPVGKKDYSERTYEGPVPSWYGEVGPTLGVIPEGARGGLQAGAYARAGEHLAVGIVGAVDGGSRRVDLGKDENFFGNSVSGAVMAGLQIGTVNGENGGNLRVSGGYEKDWQTGDATGLNGSTRNGASRGFGRLDIGAGVVHQISENVRLYISAAANFLLGRPSRLGGSQQETTVGGTVNIGISTK